MVIVIIEVPIDIIEVLGCVGSIVMINSAAIYKYAPRSYILTSISLVSLAMLCKLFDCLTVCLD